MAPLAEAFIRLRPDTDGFQAEAERSVGTMHISARVVPDVRGFAETARKLLRGTELSVRVTPDLSGFQRELDTQARLRGFEVTVRAKLDSAGLRTATFGDQTFNVSPRLMIDNFRAQFRIFEAVYLRDRTFDVSPNLNFPSPAQALLNRSMNRSGSDSGGHFAKGLANALAKVGVFAFMPTLVGSVTAAFGPLVSIVGELVVAAGGLAAALPFALTVGIAAVAALKLSLSGVGDAIKEGFKPDNVEKFNEALAKLSPAARSVVLEIVGNRAALQQFQRDVQQQFFLPLMGAFTALARSPALSVLKGVLGGVARDAGTAAAGVVRLITASARSGQLAAELAPVRAVFGDLVRAVPALVGMFLNLVGAGGKFVATMTGGVAGALTGFADRVNALISSGKMQEIFASMATTLGAIVGLLGNVFAILGSLFGGLAQQGGSVLSVLEQVTAQVSAFLKSAEGSQAIANLGKIIAGIGSLLTPILGPLLPLVGSLITALAGPFAAAVAAVGPLLNLIVSILAELANTVLVAALPPLLNLVTVLATGLIPIFESLRPVINTVAQVLGTFLAGAIVAITNHVTAMLPVFQQLVAKMGPQLGQIFEAFGQVLMSLIPIIPAISQALLAIAPVLLDLIPVLVLFAQLATVVLKGVAWVISTVLIPSISWLLREITGLVAGAIPAFNGIRDAALVVAGFFANTVAPMFMTAVRAVRDWFLMLWASILQVGTDFTNMWNTVVAWFTTVANSFVASLMQIGSFFTGLWNTVVGVVTGVNATLTGWLVFLQGVIATGVDLTVGNLIGAFIRLRDNVVGVVDSIRGVWDAGWAFMRDRVFGPMQQMITSTIPNAFRAGADAVGALWARVQGAVATPVRWVIDNVINKLIDTFNFVASKVGLPSIGRVGSIGDPPALQAGGQVGQAVFMANGGHLMEAKAKVGNVIARAANGMLTGPGGTREDRIPILASHHEFVVNAAATKQWLPVLEWINTKGRTNRIRAGQPGAQPMYADGGRPPGYADGGLMDWFAAITNPGKWVTDRIGGVLDQVPGSGLAHDLPRAAGATLLDGLVKWVKDKLASLFAGGGGPGGAGPGFLPWPSATPGAGGPSGDSGVWHNIVDLIRSTGPLSGTFGNAYRPGDPLWHGAGRAVDWMGFNQDALASFFMARRQNVLELIHRSNNRDYAVTRGADRGSFNNTLMEQHRNHVHIAMQAGGRVLAAALRAAGVRSYDGGGPWPANTLGANTSGATEYVSSGASMEALIAEVRALRADVRAIAPGVGRELTGTATVLRQQARTR